MLWWTATVLVRPATFYTYCTSDRSACFVAASDHKTGPGLGPLYYATSSRSQPHRFYHDQVLCAVLSSAVIPCQLHHLTQPSHYSTVPYETNSSAELSSSPEDTPPTLAPISASLFYFVCTLFSFTRIVGSTSRTVGYYLFLPLHSVAVQQQLHASSQTHTTL